ncbi:mycothiol conjugate amidase Mca [Euzebya tangerina]|uniref:mycothiol conjugate amidase Mca n=1 Tax=Euzebya tangerina TaxID=591198 RepID=UPI00196A2D87|nr:mycothiol conjugate amidase Mca [Euzebya tangerina]
MPAQPSRDLHAMFLHAHPDDESSKGAGTMAKYAKEGYRVSVVTFTDGSAGEILNPALQDQPEILDNMIEVRQAELAEALRIIGVTDHVDLGFPDSGYVEEFAGTGAEPDAELEQTCFYNVPMDEVLAKLVPVIREMRPQVLVTYDEKGGYPHPDHIRTHTATMAAWRAAADPTVMPEAGPAWQAAKVYYQMSFTYKRLSLLHAECERRGIETPFGEWLERWDTDKPEPITTSIDVRDHLATRAQALLAHRTQVDPEGLWFSIPDDLVREIYPFEDFQLAHTTLEGYEPGEGDLESDLFAGLV